MKAPPYTKIEKLTGITNHNTAKNTAMSSTPQRKHDCWNVDVTKGDVKKAEEEAEEEEETEEEAEMAEEEEKTEEEAEMAKEEEE